jgi:hypothetical protein
LLDVHRRTGASQGYRVMSWEQRLRDMVLAGGAGALAAIGCVDPSGAAVDSGSVDFCCNANADPCCPSLYCSAPVTTECTVKMACESDGGTWDYSAQGCGHARDAGPADAGPADAGPTDAQPDVIDPFCCNANIDPCCPSIYCGKAATPDCTDKTACESSGGMWDYPGCIRDAGTRDAP